MVICKEGIQLVYLKRTDSVSTFVKNRFSCFPIHQGYAKQVYHFSSSSSAQWRDTEQGGAIVPLVSRCCCCSSGALLLPTDSPHNPQNDLPILKISLLTLEATTSCLTGDSRVPSTSS